MDRVLKKLCVNCNISTVHIQNQCDGSPILEAEVEDDIQHMKKSKVHGLDNITTEEIKATILLVIEMITKLLNEYITVDIYLMISLNLFL